MHFRKVFSVFGGWNDNNFGATKVTYCIREPWVLGSSGDNWGRRDELLVARRQHRTVLLTSGGHAELFHIGDSGHKAIEKWSGMRLKKTRFIALQGRTNSSTVGRQRRRTVISTGSKSQKPLSSKTIPHFVTISRTAENKPANSIYDFSFE